MAGCAASKRFVRKAATSARGRYSLSVRVIIGDCREALQSLPSESVNCVVTSPPYFGLRDYGVDGQIGLEATPDAFVSELVAVFRAVRRVLRNDGTLWLNLGDTYATQGGAHGGLKPKDLIGIPWRVAFALQADGWYLRQDIIWAKPNPMPESVTDRCTKAHEYMFLLSKSPRYYYDQEAIAEPVAPATVARLAQDVESQQGSARVPGKINGTMKAKPPRFGCSKYGDDLRDKSRTKSGNEYTNTNGGMRNARSVWNIATQPFKEAHFATFPPELAERCIKAGCPEGGTVLDPFGGAGTTGLVADRLQRSAVVIELNPAYADMALNRIEKDAGLFGEIARAAADKIRAALEHQP